MKIPWKRLGKWIAEQAIAWGVKKTSEKKFGAPAAAKRE
jgi:exonuclease V gamma subunit